MHDILELIDANNFEDAYKKSKVSISCTNNNNNIIKTLIFSNYCHYQQQQAYQQMKHLKLVSIYYIK